MIDLLRSLICKCPNDASATEMFERQCSTDRISYGDVIKLFGSTGEVSATNDILHLTDRYFKLVDIDHLTKFLKNNPVSSRTYVSESHDCDDFSAILNGDVTRWDSDLAFGMVHGLTPSGGGHAWNICISTDHEIWFIEPQDDRIWKPEKNWDIWLVVM